MGGGRVQPESAATGSRLAVASWIAAGLGAAMLALGGAALWASEGASVFMQAAFSALAACL